jgi:sortase A
MKNIIKFVVSFGFVVICISILYKPKTIISESPASEPISVEASTYITTPAEETQPVVEKITPSKLSIESIGVDAPVESVGVLDGAMAVPTTPESVGWYEFGTVPGDIGSAVLAGHVNWKDNPNAVFTNLKNVKIGDIIQITNSNGQVVLFIVEKIESYPLYSDTNEVFSSNDGLAHLNLITCSGLWNSIIRSHELRLVIFTTKFEPTIN